MEERTVGRCKRLYARNLCGFSLNAVENIGRFLISKSQRTPAGNLLATILGAKSSTLRNEGLSTRFVGWFICVEYAVQCPKNNSWLSTLLYFHHELGGI